MQDQQTRRTWTTEISLNSSRKPESLPMSNVSSCVAEIFLPMTWLGDVSGYALAVKYLLVVR